MARSTHHSILGVRSMLDELHAVRCALASHAQWRDAAILRQLPPELQETVTSIMQEFADVQEEREQEEHRLAEHICTVVKTLEMAVQGTHLQATYRPGNRAWDSDGLERLAERVPEVWGYRRQGEPVVAIRVRAQRRRVTPLLYDTHGI
jgi:hypothetical protein